MLKNCYNNNFS